MSKKKELSLNKTIIFNILSVVLIQGLSFFTAPVFSRLLGTNNYGIYSSFNAWVSILVIIFPLCVNSTIAMSINEYSDEKRLAYQSSTYTLGVVGIVAFSVVTVALSPFLSYLMDMSIPMIVCMLVTTLFTFTLQYGSVRFIYNLQADKNFFIAISSSVSTIILSLVLVNAFPEETNYWGRIIGGLLSTVLLSVYLICGIYKEGKTFIRKEYIQFCLPLSIPVIFHSLSNVILNQSDRIMLQGMCSNSTSGIYSLAYNFAAIMTAIYSAFNNSWTPFYFRYLGEKDYSNLRKHSENYISLFTMITLGFLMVFKEIYRIFADERFWPGIKVIPILVVGLFFMFIYSFAVNYEFFMKQTKHMAIITSSAAILNILLNYILIKKFEANGASIATVISYGYEFLAHYIYVKKISNNDYPLKFSFYFKPLLILGVGIVLYYVLEEYVIIRWIIAILILIYILITVYKRKAIF